MKTTLVYQSHHHGVPQAEQHSKNCLLMVQETGIPDQDVTGCLLLRPLSLDYRQCLCQVLMWLVLLCVCASLVSLCVLLFYEDASQAELGTHLSSCLALNCSVKPISVGLDGVANVWNPSTQGPEIGRL